MTETYIGVPCRCPWRQSPGGRCWVGVCEVTLVLVQETQTLLLHCGPVQGRLDLQHVHLLLQVGPAVTSGNSHQLLLQNFILQLFTNDDSNSTQGKHNSWWEFVRKYHTDMTVILAAFQLPILIEPWFYFGPDASDEHFTWITCINWQQSEQQLIKMHFNSSGNQSDMQHETPRYESSVCVCVCVCVCACVHACVHACMCVSVRNRQTLKKGSPITSMQLAWFLLTANYVVKKGGLQETLHFQVIIRTPKEGLVRIHTQTLWDNHTWYTHPPCSPPLCAAETLGETAGETRSCYYSPILLPD